MFSVICCGGGDPLHFASWIVPFKSNMNAELNCKSSVMYKAFVGKVHGFCSCWSDDQMDMHRKCGGKAQEDTPSSPRLWTAGTSSTQRHISPFKCTTDSCVFEKCILVFIITVFKCEIDVCADKSTNKQAFYKKKKWGRKSRPLDPVTLSSFPLLPAGIKKLDQ